MFSGSRWHYAPGSRTKEDKNILRVMGILQISFKESSRKPPSDILITNGYNWLDDYTTD